MAITKDTPAENKIKTEWKARLLYNENMPSQSVKPNELLIESKRVGDVTGDHTVTYESVIDEIEISHRAKSRYGFAKGAVLAAEWIQGKKGLFTMDDILNL
jgi:4-hydroxy-tetrahydrodipicolinate reductase